MLVAIPAAEMCSVTRIWPSVSSSARRKITSFVSFAPVFPKNFGAILVSVESTGALESAVLVVEACKVMEKKCDSLQQNVNDLFVALLQG